MKIQGSVADILKLKGKQVWTTTPEQTVYAALACMGENDIGAMVVIEGGCVVGVLSERDYSRKIVLKGRTSRETYVNEVIKRPAVIVAAKDTVERCLELMLREKVRYLPVVEGEQLEGLISMGDLMRWVVGVQNQTIEQLQGYISGEYPT